MPRGDVDYQKGLIYTIRSRDSIYVGSTTNFTNRKNNHKTNLKKKQLKLYQTIIENDFEWDMKPYQLFPCNHKVELQIQEEKIRQTLNADLNSQSCRGFDKEKRKETCKVYYQQNKEQLDEYRKKYYDQNKEQITKQKKEKITCECGCIMRRGDIARHRKSNKHKLLLESQL